MVTKKVKKVTKKPRKLKSADRFPLIEAALRKRTKAELVETIMMLAKQHANVTGELENELNIEKPAGLLIKDVGLAIANATDFDESMSNYNFDVDWQAYKDVKKGLKQLIDLGCLEDAKSLAIRLMKDGSYQVECSDEGLMSDDISECLRPVIQAVKKAGGNEAAAWASEMQLADRVGFICDRELAALQSQS
jgi:hypothetical protein